MDDITELLRQRQNEQLGLEDGVVKKESAFLSGINVESARQLNQANLTKHKVPVKDVRILLTKLVNSIYKREDQIEFQSYMEVERKLSSGLLHQAKGFFIPDYDYNQKIFGENLKDLNLGLITEMGTPRFAGRFIYPVFGFNGEALGLIGYDKFHITKYLLSQTNGFGKSNMFYGMWLMRWIYSCGYVVVVEGIVDCIYLWSIGIPAIGLNGNTLTDFVARILKRFGFNCILMPDSDETGQRAIDFWQMKLPEASSIKVSSGKDIDEWRKHNDPQLLKDAIEEIRASALIKFKKDLTI